MGSGTFCELRGYTFALRAHLALGSHSEIGRTLHPLSGRETSAALRGEDYATLI